MKTLIIDSDRDTVKFLKERLEEKCFTADTAPNAPQGLRLAKTNTYDLIIIAHPISGQPAHAICHELRSQTHTLRRHVPIIIVSEDDDHFHKIRCFDCGADDYVLKPFFFDEFLARTHAILRRPTVLRKEAISLQDLTLDTQLKKLTLGKKSVHLTKKEYAIMEYFMIHQGMILSRTEIVEHVWDIDADPFSNMIEMHIVNLRRKLHRPGKPELIHCVVGRGYKLDIEK